MSKYIPYSLTSLTLFTSLLLPSPAEAQEAGAQTQAEAQVQAATGTQGQAGGENPAQAEEAQAGEQSAALAAPDSPDPKPKGNSNHSHYSNSAFEKGRFLGQLEAKPESFTSDQSSLAHLKEMILQDEFQQKVQREEKQDETDSQKAIKLMELGITVGAGLAVLIPTSNDNALREAAPTAMPYVAVFPGYWTGGAERNKYCASAWSLEEEDAQKAAVAKAKKWGRRVVQNALVRIAAGESAQDIAVLWSNISSDNTKLTEQAQKLVNNSTDLKTQEEVASYLGSLRWNPAYKGRCGGTKWGLWVGRPLNFEATRNENHGPANGAEHVTFRPDIAAGFALTPNAYVTFLLGATYGRFNPVTPHDKSTADEFLYTVALGGNIDFLLRFFQSSD